MWPIWIMFSFIFICVIIKIYRLYVAKQLVFFKHVFNFSFFFFTFTYFCISLSHFALTYIKNISYFSFSFTYISLSHSLLSIFNVAFASHTFSISLSHTLNAIVPYGYVETLSNVCNLLSSSLLSAILLTSSVYTLWWSLLNLCCDFYMILSLNKPSL